MNCARLCHRPTSPQLWHLVVPCRRYWHGTRHSMCQQCSVWYYLLDKLLVLYSHNNFYTPFPVMCLGRQYLGAHKKSGRPAMVSKQKTAKYRNLQQGGIAAQEPIEQSERHWQQNPVRPMAEPCNSRISRILLFPLTLHTFGLSSLYLRLLLSIFMV